MYAMLFFTALLCCLSFTDTLVAQSTSTRHEAGLQFSGVNFNGDNSFNVVYKKEISGNRFRRFRAAFGQLDVIYVGREIQSSLEAGIYFGVEQRKKEGDRLVFYDGWEAGAKVARLNNNSDFSRWTIGAEIGYVLGLQHEFNDRWAINIETVPGIRTRFLKTRGEKLLTNVSAGFTSLASMAIIRSF